MTVRELIEFLKKQPQDMQVAYSCYSEQCLLEKDEIMQKVCSECRADGWVHNARPDRPLVTYLVFPGN